MKTAYTLRLLQAELQEISQEAQLDEKLDQLDQLIAQQRPATVADDGARRAQRVMTALGTAVPHKRAIRVKALSAHTLHSQAAHTLFTVACSELTIAE